MVTGQAAAVRGNSAYLLDGQTYPWISSASSAAAPPSRLANNRNALAATQAALATNLTSEELIRRNPQRPSSLIHGFIQLNQWVSKSGVSAIVKLVISGVNSELVSRI